MENNAAWKFAHHDVDLTEADRSKYAGRGRSRDRKAVAGSGLVNKLLSIGLGRANGATNSVPPSRQGDEDIVDGYASSQRLPRVPTENGRGGAKRAGPAEERHWAQDPAVLVLPEPDVRTKDSTFDEIEKQAKELFPDTHYIAPREKVANRTERSVEAWCTPLRPSVDDRVTSTLVAPTNMTKTKVRGPHYRKPVPQISVSPTRPLYVAKATPRPRSPSPYDASRVAATARAMDLAARRTYRKPPNYAILDEGLTVSEIDQAMGGITISGIDGEDEPEFHRHAEKVQPDILDPFMYEELRSLLETHRIKKELKKYYVVVVPSRMNPIRGNTDVATWIEKQDRIGSSYNIRINALPNTKHYLSFLRFEQFYTKS